MAKTTPIKNASEPSVIDYSKLSYYPWQSNVWRKLYTSSYSQNGEVNHFPHALLLAGISGIGKKDLALYLAKALLCQSPQKNSKTSQIEPCSSDSVDSTSVCRSCQLFNSVNHPDFNHITTPEDKKVIPVDVIRELIEWSVLSSQFDGKKIILIEPAEAMNANAANSLLKTLEEPVSNAIIILVTNKKQALLPTIRSRCQTIDMALPDTEYAIPWLKQAGLHNSQLLLSLASGAPLLALELANSDQLNARNMIFNHLIAIANDGADPVSRAEELFKKTNAKKSKAKKNSSKSKKDDFMLSAHDVIYWMDSFISDLARLTHNCDQDTITNRDHIQNLQLLVDRLDLKKVLQLSDLVNKAYYEIQGQININLLFEKLLIDWKNCTK